MSQRIEKVRELMRRELSTVLDREYTKSGVIITIHDLQPTDDLKECFVYVGMIGKESNHDNILERLNKERGMIQKTLYKRVILRSSPKLIFRIDRSVERGVRILNAIESIPPPSEEDSSENNL
jgi:ribosome-binding factor A